MRFYGPPRPAAERRAPGEPYGTVPGTCHRRVQVGPTSVTGSNGRTGIPRRVPCLRVKRFSSGCTSQSVGIRDIRPLARTNRGRDASGRLDELRRPAHGAGGAMRGGYAVRARSGHGVVASVPSRVVRTPALRRSAAASLDMGEGGPGWATRQSFRGRSRRAEESARFCQVIGDARGSILSPVGTCRWRVPGPSGSFFVRMYCGGLSASRYPTIDPNRRML